MKRLICKLFGHRYLAIPTGGNPHGPSVWGWFHCTRCGYDERYQFDD